MFSAISVEATVAKTPMPQKPGARSQSRGGGTYDA